MTNLSQNVRWLGPLLTTALVTSWLSPRACAQFKEPVRLEGSADFGFRFSCHNTLLVAVGESEVKGGNRPVPRDWEVKIWNVATGRVKARLPGIAPLPAALSADGTLLAVPVHGATVRLWDVTTGKDLGTLVVDTDLVLAVEFSPDGKYVATGNGNDTVALWELASGRQRILRGHESTVFCVAFSPGGKVIASGSRDSTVRLWDVASGAEKTRFRGHPGAVTSIVFSSDRRHLVSYSADLKHANPTTVTIWDLSTGEMRARLKGYGLLALSDDGKLLATIKEGQTLDVWNMFTVKREFTHELKAGAIAVAGTFSRDGKLLAVIRDNSQFKLEPLQ